MDGRGTGPLSGNDLSGRVTGNVMQFGSVEQAHFHGSSDSSHVGPPRQLPPITTLFTGRTDDHAWLDQQWNQSVVNATGALLVISGTAGVGKTALATAWAQAHAEDFPDGQLYADLGGYSQQQTAGSEDILGGFLRALGVAPDHVPARLAERVALLRTITHDRRVCVLLDNAVSAAQVRVLAMTAPGCATLVTTRGSISGLTMDGAHFHQLDPWRAETAVAFIRRALGEARVREEPDAARQVAELCGGLPLALGVVAAKLASRPRWTLGRLAEALARDGGQFKLLEIGDGSAVMPALDGSYRILDDDLARLYRALGRCPVLWFEPFMVAAVINAPVEEAEERIDALVEANLLEALDDRNDRHRFHDLVRLHAAHCADQAPSREGDEAFARLLDFYLASATAAEEIMTPSHRTRSRDYRCDPVARARFSGEKQALEWLDRHRDNLMAALRYCARREQHRIVWQLVDAMWPLFLRLRYTEDRLEAQTMAVEAAHADGDKVAEGSLLLSLASTLAAHERQAEAAKRCDQALKLCEQLGDERGLAQAYNRRAKLHVQLGEWDEAEDLFQKALEIRERIGYRRGAALTYQGLGKVAAARGDFDVADEYLRRSHVGLAAEGDRYDAAWSQALRAQAVADLGDPGRALGLLDEAAALMQSTGSVFGRAGLLEISGRIHQAMGDQATAGERYQEAAELFAASDPVAARRTSLRLSELSEAAPGTTADTWRL
jgi:tetratricopeptide (TPR) repeat protein